MSTPRQLDVTFTAPIERLPLRAAICTAIGKSRAGEEVTVHLQQRLS